MGICLWLEAVVLPQQQAAVVSHRRLHHGCASELVLRSGVEGHTSNQPNHAMDQNAVH